MTREEKRGEDLFEKYVMGFVRVLVLGAFGGGFGYRLSAVVLDRFWPGRELPLEYVGVLLGIIAAFYLFRLLRDWKGISGLMGR